jgi:hypothetical protein
MRTGERRLITETPEMHRSQPMQAYISKEVNRPCKQWIHEVLDCRREAERVKLRTPDFVLLPDVECASKRPRQDQVMMSTLITPNTGSTHHTDFFIKDTDTRKQWRMKRTPPPAHCLHWLAVATDTNLRTLRDLRGCHADMIQTLYTKTCQRIHEETGIDTRQIMAYVHYPPSVYQLHVHFKHMAGSGLSHDTLRMHPLPSIINNLKIDPDYYAKSRLQMPVYVHSDLYAALGLEPVLDSPETHPSPQTEILNQLQSGNQPT